MVGGGPAGLMAAYAAASEGAQVLLLEKNERPGRKLLITGKGRCNVTNNCTEEEFLQNITTNPKFLYSAIRRFSIRDTMDFFESRGVPLKTERGNRVFPVSDKAADILSALLNSCRKAGVRLEKGNTDKIILENGTAVGVCCGGTEYRGSRIILATGGKSYPQTGSTGEGYRMAKECGHTITEICPLLVPLISEDEACADMQGLSLRNVELCLIDKKKGKPVFREVGEMLFTHYGMSGPLILSASAHIRPFEKGRYEVRIDCKPGLTEKQLDARILRAFSEMPNREFANGLTKLLPKKLIPIVVMRSGIPPLLRINQISREQRLSFVALLKGISFSVDGFRPISEAIVTSGGVSVKELSPQTMESKLVKGLYFAGEIIDVDGYTGGFNLQIAFSTGFAAGIAAAGEMRK